MSQILDRVLTAARQLGASDVHLKAGLPTIFRIKGDLWTVRDVPALTRESIAQPQITHPANQERRAMNSRSRASTSSWLVLIALLLLTGVASAGGRKRVVVLEFDGDKAEKFHADLVKILKKSHTVVSTDKWNGAAEELSATTFDKSSIKKVAKKLKVDGVITGNVEK